MPGDRRQVPGQAGREGEIAADRLPDVAAEDAVDQRVADVVGDRAVVLVTDVYGGDVVESAHERFPQISYPRRSNALQVGIHDDYELRVQLDAGPEEVAQVVPLAQDTLLRGYVDLRLLGGGFHEDLPGTIRRVVVNIDDHRLGVGEEISQSSGGDVGRVGDTIRFFV